MFTRTPFRQISRIYSSMLALGHWPLEAKAQSQEIAQAIRENAAATRELTDHLRAISTPLSATPSLQLAPALAEGANSSAHFCSLLQLAPTFVKSRVRTIPPERVRFLGVATVDPVGRPFAYEDNIFRGIYPQSLELVLDIFASGLMRELIESGAFIETEITDFQLTGFSLVLKHKRITGSIPTMWTASMLRDAALTILKVNKICNKYGYELKDSHPFNVSFDNNKAKWIDFGSIGRKQAGWGAKADFINYTIAPLVFLQKKELMEAYCILLSERSLHIALKPFRQTILFSQFLSLIGESLDSYSDDLIDETWITDFCVTTSINASTWADYQHGKSSLLADLKPYDGNRFNRFFQVSELIGIHASDAKTCVDLAGNGGLASLIISEAHPQLRCLNTDYDENSIDKSYELLQEYPEFRVESYLLNFMLPMDPDSPSIFRSDIVLAMAITHHLLLSQGHQLAGIFEKISAYSSKYVFIEFMPLGLWGGDPLNKPSVPDWYTIEWFESQFLCHYRLLEKKVIESHLIAGIVEPHRVMFIGQLR